MNDRWREKMNKIPIEKRRKLRVGISGGIMVIVLAFWIPTLPGRFGGGEVVKDESKGPSPFKTILSSVSDAYANLRNQIDDSKNLYEVQSGQDTEITTLDKYPVVEFENIEK